MESNQGYDNTLTAKLGVRTQLACLDLSAALDRVCGDVELLKEIARLFLDTAPEQMAEIRAALERRDAEALQHAAHSLKGSVGNFGTGDAWKAAYAVECIGRQGELAQAAAAVQALERALAQLEPELEALSSES